MAATAGSPQRIHDDIIAEAAPRILPVLQFLRKKKFCSEFYCEPVSASPERFDLIHTSVGLREPQLDHYNIIIILLFFFFYCEP